MPHLNLQTSAADYQPLSRIVDLEAVLEAAGQRVILPSDAYRGRHFRPDLPLIAHVHAGDVIPQRVRTELVPIVPIRAPEASPPIRGVMACAVSQKESQEERRKPVVLVGGRPSRQHGHAAVEGDDFGWVS